MSKNAVFTLSYSQLPNSLFSPAQAMPVQRPNILLYNHALAQQLQLPALTAQQLAGQMPLGNVTPIAQAYAGHQFGHFNVLGDGRAMLLAEWQTPQGLVDIALKGSGRTAYSRRGDGMAALAPMLREYIVSEAMAGLNIPTTRSLAVLGTEHSVFRQTTQPAGILVRTALSHIRVGTLQYAAAMTTPQTLKALVDYSINRHYPQCWQTLQPYVAFLNAVVQQQANLVAQWQAVGFVHGVMNTDNMSIAGETIDYGPCAFIDTFKANTVFSSIDEQGRYAYNNQPHMAQWNLARLAEAILPLLNANQNTAIDLANEAVHQFVDEFEAAWLKLFAAKLGLGAVLESHQTTQIKLLIQQFLELLESQQLDFTQTFRQLSDPENHPQLLQNTPALTPWWQAWQNLQPNYKQMQQQNPAIIARNFRVEEALAAATLRQDLQPLNRLVTALQKPFENNADFIDLQRPPANGLASYVTFCGT